jgi:hypothetical protein
MVIFAFLSLIGDQGRSDLGWMMRSEAVGAGGESLFGPLSRSSRLFLPAMSNR